MAPAERPPDARPEHAGGMFGGATGRGVCQNELPSPKACPMTPRKQRFIEEYARSQNGKAAALAAGYAGARGGADGVEAVAPR